MAEFARAEEPRRTRILRWTRRALLATVAVAVLAWVVDPTLAGTGVRDRVRDLVDPGEHGEHAFLIDARNGGGVGWDPCTPIRYAVNPEDAPEDWERIVDSAVRLAADASGFELEYVGTSEARPVQGPSQRGVPLLISWADPDEVPELAGSTVGVTFPQGVVKRARSYYFSSAVALDEEQLATLSDEQEPVMRLAHELGHVLGLDDVDDEGELMNEEYVGQDGFGPGDREGLREVHDVPCA